MAAVVKGAVGRLVNEPFAVIRTAYKEMFKGIKKRKHTQKVFVAWIMALKTLNSCVLIPSKP